ncbi:hypothetical protein BGX27_007406, partial [Mortierella sp. AM989]
MGEALKTGPIQEFIILYAKMRLINEVEEAKTVDSKAPVSSIVREHHINAHTANKAWD